MAGLVQPEAPWEPRLLPGAVGEPVEALGLERGVRCDQEGAVPGAGRVGSVRVRRKKRRGWDEARNWLTLLSASANFTSENCP